MERKGGEKRVKYYAQLNMNLVWDKLSQRMADGGYSRRAQQCRVKVNNLKQNYHKIRDDNNKRHFSLSRAVSMSEILMMIDRL